MRLCGDFKVTVNPQLVVNTYPLPTLDDLQEKMNGGCLFSKLDLSKAYSQIPLHEESRKYTTLTTHKGVYAYNRLPFGISSAAAIFQRNMDHIFHDMPRVLCYPDDILVTGGSREEHLTTWSKCSSAYRSMAWPFNKKKMCFPQAIVKVSWSLDWSERHSPTTGQNWGNQEAAWLSGQSWGFECGRPGFKSPTRTTEWICPRWSQEQIHNVL